MKPLGIKSALIGLILFLPAPWAKAQDWRACSQNPQERGEVLDVNRNGELILQDGRLISLAGLVPLHLLADSQARREKMHSALMEWLVGQTIGLNFIQAKPDRWGRMKARAYYWVRLNPAPASLAVSERERMPILITQALVDAGLGLVQPDQMAGSCLLALYRAEAQARSQRLGFWADENFRLLQASDQQSLRQKAGEWVLVEGKIFSANETKFRTYLNMGPRRGIDVSLVIAKTNLKSFQQRGMLQASLQGRRILVHGILDMRSSLLIEISGPDAIELLN
jgi:hypothetical protein